MMAGSNCRLHAVNLPDPKMQHFLSTSFLCEFDALNHVPRKQDLARVTFAVGMMRITERFANFMIIPLLG